MKGLNIIILAVWLIAQGLVTLLDLSFSGMEIIFAIVQIAAGILLLLMKKKDQIFSKIANLLLSIWLIARGVVAIFEIDFSGMEIIFGILAIAAGVLIIIGMKKGTWSKHLGGFLLAIWLMIIGLIAVIELAFSGLPVILAILAIASGILLLLKK